MCPDFGGRLGKRWRSGFFFRHGWSSFSSIFLDLELLYIPSAHIRIRREEDVNEMLVAPKTFTKLSFGPIIANTIESQMTSLLTWYSYSLAINPPSNLLYDLIDSFWTAKNVLQYLTIFFQRVFGCLLFTHACFRVSGCAPLHPSEKRLSCCFGETCGWSNIHNNSVRRWPFAPPVSVINNAVQLKHTAI